MASLRTPTACYILKEKYPMPTHNMSDFEYFYEYSPVYERKHCQNKGNMYKEVCLIKTNDWIHWQASEHLRQATFWRKNTHCPYTTSRTLSIFMNIHQCTKEKIAKIRPTCANMYFSLKQMIGFIGKPPAIYGHSKKYLVSVHNKSDFEYFYKEKFPK